MKIRPVGTELSHVDEQTSRSLTVAFRNFANGPKNSISSPSRVYLFIYLFIIHLFICLFICLFIYLFTYLFIYLFVYLFTYLFICLFFCLFVCLFVYLFVRSFVCLFVFIYLFMSYNSHNKQLSLPCAALTECSLEW